MNKIIAVAASVLLNLGVIVAFERNVDAAQLPKGEVTVTELNVEAVPVLAQAVTDATRPVAL